jgi:hypothetical protein
MKFLNLENPIDFKKWEVVINSGGAWNNNLGICPYKDTDQCNCKKYESDNEDDGDNNCNFVHYIGKSYGFCELQIKGAV